MCNMAAYAGKGRAAEELIRLLQVQEGLAGGHFTGIATLHEGKIYVAKVCGDCKRLLEQTDALNLPGSIGIAHSRTPGIDSDEWAQPFLTSDGANVFCSNGIGPADVLPADTPRELQRGFDIATAAGLTLRTGIKGQVPHYTMIDDGNTYHDTEIRGAWIGVYNRSMPLFEVLERVFFESPAQCTSLAMSTREPGQLSAIRYNQSLFFGRKDDAYCLATSGTAFQDFGYSWIAPVPPASTAVLRPDAIEIREAKSHIGKLTVTPDLHRIWCFLDTIFADGAPHGVIDVCDELPKHLDLDPKGISAQDSFAVYSYLMEMLRTGRLVRSTRRVPGSRKDSMRDEAVFTLVR